VAPRPPYVANYLPGLIKQGLGPTAALRTLRAPVEEGGLGLGIRTQTFYQLYAATQSQLASGAAIAQAPLGRAPLASEVTTMPAVRSTGRVYNVDLLVFDPNTKEFYYTPSAIRTDKAVTYRTALQGASQALTSAVGAQDPRYQALVVHGGVVTSVVDYVAAG